MDEFLNDEQLKRLFDRNLPKQPLPPDMAERLLRRVNAEVRSTYSPQQRPQPLARQLAQRRTSTQNPPLPLATAAAKSSGRSWIFSSSPSTWLTFVGTVAAAVMFAVLFSRTSLFNPITRAFPIPTETSVALGLPSSPSVTPSATQATTIPDSGGAAVPSSETPTPETPSEPTVTAPESVAETNTATETQTESLVSPTPRTTPKTTGGGASTTATRTSTPTPSSVVGATAGPTKATATSTPTPPKRGTPSGGRTPTATYTAGQNSMPEGDSTRTATPTPRATRPSNTTGATTPLPTSDQASVAGQGSGETPNPQSTPTRTRSNAPTASATPTVRIHSINSTGTPTRTPTATKTAYSEPRATLTPTRGASNPSKGESTNTPVPTRTPTRTATATNGPFVPPTQTRVPTRVPTRTPTRSATTISAPVSEPTDTPIPTRTSTRTPTRTEVPTNVPTRTLTDTPVPTSTYTRRPTSTPTETQTATSTATRTRTETPEPTDTKTATPTDTPTDTATATPTPTATNSPPTVGMLVLQLDEDTQASGDVLSVVHDADGDPIQLVDITQPANGDATMSGSWIYYKPKQDYTGLDQFNFTIRVGDDQFVGTVRVTVDKVNDAPIVTPITKDVPANTTVIIEPLKNAHDVDNDELTLFTASGALHGTVTKNGNLIIYTPNPSYLGGDMISFQVWDRIDSPVEERIALNVYNIVPVAADDTTSTDEGKMVQIPVLQNDSDANNDPLSVVGVSASSNSVVTTDGTVLFYTPNPNFSGPDTISYVVSDGHETATANVQVTVTPNNPPKGTVPAITVAEDAPEGKPFDALNGITDDDGDPLSIVNNSLLKPDHGTAELNGTQITYVPEPNYNGADKVKYQVTDGKAMINVEVDVTVDVRNDIPTAEPTSVSLDQDTPSTIDLFALVHDIDGDPLTIEITVSPMHGQLVPDGSAFTYIPESNYFGPDSFTYRVSDREDSATAIVTISVDPVATPTPTDAPTSDPTATQASDVPTQEVTPTDTSEPTPTDTASPTPVDGGGGSGG